jgi:hypothetical protein
MARKHNTAVNTLKGAGIDAATAIVGGGTLGAFLGPQPGFIAGLAALLAGEYYDNKHLKNLGIGMAVSAGFGNLAGGTTLSGDEPATNGTEGFVQDGTNRVKSVWAELRKRLSLKKAAPTNAGAKGLGEPGAYLPSPFNGPEEFGELAEPEYALNNVVGTLGNPGSEPATKSPVYVY